MRKNVRLSSLKTGLHFSLGKFGNQTVGNALDPSYFAVVGTSENMEEKEKERTKGSIGSLEDGTRYLMGDDVPWNYHLTFHTRSKFEKWPAYGVRRGCEH